MSEAVTMPSLIMAVTSNVSEESLARDTQADARTHTHKILVGSVSV